MDPEDVETVVIAEALLHHLHEEVAEGRGDEAEGDRPDRADEARGRGDGDEARDRPEAAPSIEALPRLIAPASDQPTIAPPSR